LPGFPFSLHPESIGVKSGDIAMKKIRLGVIGCGGWVGYHLRLINESVPEMQIVALCDIVPEHAEDRRKKFCPGRRVPIFLDYREMLKKANLDAVLVSTPHTLHFRHAYDSLAAGCHVQVDKPMVTDSSQARKLVRQAEKTGKCLEVAVQGMYTDTFAYAKQLMSAGADGLLGKLQMVTGITCQNWMTMTVGKWRQVPKLSGGGQLYDTTSHVLSAMMFLVDEPVVEVACFTDNLGCDVDINAVGCIRFASGAMATITSGGNSPGWKTHLTFQCDKARMEISPHGGNFLIHRDGHKRDILKTPKGFDIPKTTPIRNFADVILGKEAQPRCGGRMGVLLADLMDGLYESARTGKVVKMPKRK